MPKVSICIPTYNSPDTLQRLLESIYSQTYTDYEIIISDDSTNDKVQQIAERYKENRLTYIHNPKALGTPENWNNAVRHASGEYIKIMHHDDWFVNKDALSIMVNVMEVSHADFVFCQSAGDEPNCPTEDSMGLYIGNRLPFLLSGNVIGAPSATMYKKTTLEYDANIKYFVDVDFYIQYLNGSKFQYIPQELVWIGTTPVRVTDAVVQDREFIYNEFQYAYLKLWTSGVWKHSLLKEVFRLYIKDNPDFITYSVEGLTAAQKYIVWQQGIRERYKQLKRKIKKAIR